MRRTAAPLLVVALALTGCSGDDAADEEAGALAAAQAYVDAISALDLEAVEAMTDSSAFEHIASDPRDVDIRTALTDAVDPITDPWVSIASRTDESQYGATEFVVDVSYTIRDLTGGGTIVVRLEEDGDAGDLDDWKVTEALLVHAATYADGLTMARIGSVEFVGYSDTGYEPVVGYPGGYLLDAADPDPDIEPLWIAVGAADAPPWDDSLPQLGPRE